MKDKLVSANIRLPYEIKRFVNEHAIAKGSSISEVFREWIVDYIRARRETIGGQLPLGSKESIRESPLLLFLQEAEARQGTTLNGYEQQIIATQQEITILREMLTQSMLMMLEILPTSEGGNAKKLLAQSRWQTIQSRTGDGLKKKGIPYVS